MTKFNTEQQCTALADDQIPVTKMKCKVMEKQNNFVLESNDDKTKYKIQRQTTT